jgi:hypothetical protein
LLGVGCVHRSPPFVRGWWSFTRRGDHQARTRRTERQPGAITLSAQMLQSDVSCRTGC